MAHDQSNKLVLFFNDHAIIIQSEGKRAVQAYTSIIELEKRRAVRGQQVKSRKQVDCQRSSNLLARTRSICITVIRVGEDMPTARCPLLVVMGPPFLKEEVAAENQKCS